MKQLRVSASAVIALAVLCGSAPFGVGAETRGTSILTGSVQIVSRPARRLATAGVYPGRIVGIQSERDTSELENVVVFVNTSSRVDATPRRVTIRQTSEEFVPHLVAVTTGSTVEFPNDDLIFHNVFSLSRAATFDLGRYPRNVSKARTFTQPGIVKVYCHLHSHMSAIVRVFAHPYFAIPARNGRFTIADVPAGRLEVTAWHERAGEVTQVVNLEDGTSNELTFSLPLSDRE